MLTPTTTSPPQTASGTGSSADSLLPAAGRELAATVRSVAANGGGAGVFRIQVEVNSRLLELTTSAPLAQGDRVVLQRGNSGELQIRLPAAPQPAPQGSTSTPSQVSVLLQITGADAGRLPTLLPLNTPRNAQVVGSEPTSTSASRTPSAPPQPSANQAGTQDTRPASTAAANTAPPARPTPSAPSAQASSSTTPGTGTPQGSTPVSAGNSAPSAQPQTGTSQTPIPAPTSTSAPIQSGSTTTAFPARADTGTAQLNNNPQTPTDAQPRGQQPAAPAAPAPTPTTTTPASAAATTPPQASTPQVATNSTTAQAQTYPAQLQSLPAGQAGTSTPTTPPPASINQTTGQGQGQAPTSTAVTQSTSQGVTSSTPSGVPSNTTVSDSASRNAPPPPASSTSAQQPASPQITPQASVSHTGQALLQTLGRQTPAQPESHLIRLSVNSQTLNLISPKPMLNGQQVVITRVGEQQVSLQPLPAPSLPAQETTAQQQMQLALKDALPKQISFGDALNQLTQLSQSPAGRSQGAIGQLVQSMLSMFSVSPGSADAEQAIQRNLQQGGLLTESRLAQGGAGERTSAPDLKQQLGQLLKAAEQLPEEAKQQMTRLVDALQSRSTAQQVHSLQAWKDQPDGSQERVYRLDLPIRQADHHDNAELTITEQRRRSSGGEMETLWGVALHFNLDQHGSVDARLSLSEGWRLHIQFWAEHAPTLRQIEQSLNGFSDNLHRKGFLVETIQARQGRPSQPELTDVQRRLVDVHT